MIHNEATNETLDNVDVYDNDGETFDRYTVVIDNDLANCIGMSNNPNHPQGYNQYAGVVSQKFLDTQKKIDIINDKVFKAIQSRIAE